MSFGPEHLSPHQVKTEQRSATYRTQIAAIEDKLWIGTRTIKEGHRVAGLNPTGEFRELPLSKGQRERLEWNLAVLNYRLGRGPQRRWNDELPEDLRESDPQHSSSGELEEPIYPPQLSQGTLAQLASRSFA